MEHSARLFNCVRCHRQVIICRDCDRGNIYCSPACSRPVRKASIQAAGCRYQTTRRGKHKHAERQRQYRRRQKEKVTHQGSKNPPDHDLLPTESKETSEQMPPSVAGEIKCHFCGKSCSLFVRLDSLGRHGACEPSSWPLGP